MKVLSLRQPWASLIVMGDKRIENRSWPTDYRGRIAIHASARLGLRDWSEIVGGPPVPLAEGVILDDGTILPALSALPLGAILGSVEVVDCKRFEELPKRLRDDPHSEEGGFCWLVENPRPLAEPYPCKGKLRLWESPTGCTLE